MGNIAATLGVGDAALQESCRSMDQLADYAERRSHQRFLAKRGDSTCFWVELEGTRYPLNDVSLEGFSVPGDVPLRPGQEFSFALRLDGIPDRIRGKAQVVNQVAGGLLGSRFLTLDSDGASDLKEWLTAHVIASASVRISAAEAEAIVQGPSLI